MKCKLIQLQEEELKTQDPSFWNDPREAEKQMKVIRSIKIWTDGFKEIDLLVGDFQVLYEFFETEEATEKEVDAAFREVLVKVEELEARNIISTRKDIGT